MRLPWPFGRTTPSDGPSSESAGGPRGDADAPAANQTAADAPPTGAWASLPPIQRTVGATPLVAPTAPFLDAVPGHRPLPPIVQPLGHEVVPTAPAGLVAAHVSPVPSLTSHAAMPTRHVQRRAAGPAGPSPETWSEADPGVSPAAASEAPVDASHAPIRHVAPVAASQTVTPPARPLTVAPPIASNRGPVAQRSAAPSAASQAATPVTGPAELPLAARGTPPARTGSRWSETPASAPVAGLGAPIASASTTSGSPRPASATAPAPVTPAVQRNADPTTPSTSGAAESGRRAGLGAPMASLPPTAARASLPGMPLIQRSVSAETIARAIGAGSGGAPTGPVSFPLLPAATGGSPTGASDAHAGHDHGSGPGGAASTASTGATGPLPPARGLPVLPVARQRSDAAATPIQRSASSGAPAGAPASAPAGPGASRPASAPTILPLLGARPLRPSVVVPRGGDAGSAEPGEPDLPVVARWASGESAQDVDHGSGLGGGNGAAPVPLQRLAASPAPAAATAAAATPVSQPATSPAPVREMLFATPGWSSAGLPPDVPITTGGAPTMLAAPSIQRAVPARDGQASLQLARPAAAAAPAQPERRTESPASSSQPAATPTVQTSPAALTPPMLTATPNVQRIEGAAPPVEDGGAGQSDTELDELSRKLFGRLRGQLRAELTQEREARGLSFDAF